uniref:Putative serine/threonine-protein kinase n=1 Tax=Anopheles triannulatus TaxID=58253 RepID=A0A2M4B3B6_9DIPT
MHRSVVVVLLLSATIALSMASPRRIHTGNEADAPAQSATLAVPDVTPVSNPEVDASTYPEQELLANGEEIAEDDDDEEADQAEEAVVPIVAAKGHAVEEEKAVEHVEPEVAEAQNPSEAHEEVAVAAAAAEEVETVKPLSSNDKTADYVQEPQTHQSALEEIVNMLAKCYEKAASVLSSAVETVTQ